MTFFFSFLMAMFVTMSLIPILIRKAESWHFVDIPDQRKVHNNAIPRIGGLAMVTGSIISVLLWLTPNTTVLSLLSGIAVVFGFGIWDDRRNLGYKTKFIGQSIGVLIVIVWGGVKITNIPLIAGGPVSEVVAIPITFLFLLGVTNAINLSDGLDGLAGGTTMLTLGVIAVLGYFERDVVVVLVSIAVLGSIMGFLRFNTHPARIFMGDGGSQFLGFSAGVLTVLLTQNATSSLSPAVPLLLMGLPILDTLFVMGQRIYERRSPFSPDRKHIHHKLLALGFDHYEAVFVVYVMQSILVLAAYFLRSYPDFIIIVSYLIFSLAVISFFMISDFYHWKLRKAGETSNVRPLIAKGVRRFRQYQYEGIISNYAFWIACATLPLFLISSAVHADTVSMDFGILSVLLITIFLVIFLLNKNQVSSFIDRMGLYVACTLITYFNNTTINSSEILPVAINIYIAILALVVAVGFMYCKDSKFKLSTLDYLVIFIAFLMPNLPGLDVSENLSIAVAQLLILYYAVELIVTNINRRTIFLKPVIFMIFSIFAFKAFYLS